MKVSGTGPTAAAGAAQRSARPPAEGFAPQASEGAREAVRVALLGPDSPTGTFTRWEGETIPW